MKIQPMASALRVTMSPADATAIIDLARAAKDQGIYISSSLASIVNDLARGADDVRMKQATRRATKDEKRRRVEHERAYNRWGTLDGYTFTAVRSDYADFSRDPDLRFWRDLYLAHALGDALPDQAEIRRDCWLVRVTYPRDRWYEGKVIVGSDCTDSADPEQIEPLARLIIERSAVS